MTSAKHFFNLLQNFLQNRKYKLYKGLKDAVKHQPCSLSLYKPKKSKQK